MEIDELEFEMLRMQACEVKAQMKATLMVAERHGLDSRALNVEAAALLQEHPEIRAACGA